MSRTRLIIKRGFAVMLSLVLLIGATACGNSSGQSEGGQDTLGQIESSSGKDITADLDGQPVAEESGVGAETEAPENIADGVGTASAEEETESNILIAYFSRVGNMDFDEDIDAVTSASVNMDGSDVSGNAQLLAEMAQEVTGGDLFFNETVEKYPAEYRGTY